MSMTRALSKHLRALRRPLTSVTAASALLLSGVTLSLLLFFYVRSWEHRALQAEVTTHAQERVEILRAKISSSMDVLRSIDSLFATQQNVSRKEFASFVSSALARQPELCALGWTPRVPSGERSAFEEAARRDGVKGFQFVEMDPSGTL